MPSTLEIRTDANPMLAMFGRIRQTLDAPTRDGAGEGAMQAVHIYAGAMRRRFNDAAAGNGEWAALKPATIARKKRLTAWPERILYLTGRLYSSLVPDEPDNVFDVMSDRIRYGTATPYAGYHQQGGGRLPRRSILIPPNEDILQKCIQPIRESWMRTLETHASSFRTAA
jgi:phage gpG-like protein